MIVETVRREDLEGRLDRVGVNQSRLPSRRPCSGLFGVPFRQVGHSLSTEGLKFHFLLAPYADNIIPRLHVRLLFFCASLLCRLLFLRASRRTRG